jgi:non-heme chloroperoxidase
MAYITAGEENSTPVELYYEDHGAGRPVVLVHGFPLSGRAWERQERAMIAAGHRVITYDRRGFGKSARPAAGYDDDTLAADLDKLVTALDLREFDIAGHSMGGGEIARYLGTYGSDRVRRAVIISGIPPYLLKTDQTPQGVPQEVFDQIARAPTNSSRAATSPLSTARTTACAGPTPRRSTLTSSRSSADRAFAASVLARAARTPRPPR